MSGRTQTETTPIGEDLPRFDAYDRIMVIAKKTAIS